MNREQFINKLKSIQNNAEGHTLKPEENGVMLTENGQAQIQYQLFNKYYRCKNDIQKLQEKFTIEHDA